jgi:hypothetical protein
MNEGNTQEGLFACKRCGQSKQRDAFVSHRGQKHGIDTSSCKECRRVYMQQRIRSGKHKIDKRTARYVAKGIDRNTARQLALIGPQTKRLITPDDCSHHYSKLSIVNARQAWKHWLTNMAPQEWLASYYAAAPWQAPNLSNAERFRMRYRGDPEFRRSKIDRQMQRRQTRLDRIADRIRDAIKNNKALHGFESYVYYSVADFKRHFQKQFTKGMSWEAFNDGRIHIDHIVPVCDFKYESMDDKEWQSCWCLSNMRPVWAEENRRKHNRREFLL